MHCCMPCMGMVVMMPSHRAWVPGTWVVSMVAHVCVCVCVRLLVCMHLLPGPHRASDHLATPHPLAHAPLHIELCNGSTKPLPLRNAQTRLLSHMRFDDTTDTEGRTILRLETPSPKDLPAEDIFRALPGNLKIKLDLSEGRWLAAKDCCERAVLIPTAFTEWKLSKNLSVRDAVRVGDVLNVHRAGRGLPRVRLQATSTGVGPNGARGSMCT